MLANLATSLFEHGKITTTEAKAKRVRPLAEKLITNGVGRGACLDCHGANVRAVSPDGVSGWKAVTVTSSPHRT